MLICNVYKNIFLDGWHILNNSTKEILWKTQILSASCPHTKQQYFYVKVILFILVSVFNAAIYFISYFTTFLTIIINIMKLEKTERHFKYKHEVLFEFFQPLRINIWALNAKWIGNKINFPNGSFIRGNVMEMENEIHSGLCK